MVAIDFKKNTIKINHTIVKARKIIAKDKPKTSSSKREYIILPEIKEVLKSVKSEQKKDQKLIKILVTFLFTIMDYHLNQNI